MARMWWNSGWRNLRVIGPHPTRGAHRQSDHAMTETTDTAFAALIEGEGHSFMLIEVDAASAQAHFDDARPAFLQVLVKP